LEQINADFLFWFVGICRDRLAFHACLEADQRMILGENDETDPA